MALSLQRVDPHINVRVLEMKVSHSKDVLGYVDWYQASDLGRDIHFAEESFLAFDS